MVNSELCVRQEQILARNADFAQVHCGISCGTLCPAFWAWNGTHNDTCHALIWVTPDVDLVIEATAALPAEDLVIEATAALPAEGLVIEATAALPAKG